MKNDGVQIRALTRRIVLGTVVACGIRRGTAEKTDITSAFAMLFPATIQDV